MQMAGIVLHTKRERERGKALKSEITIAKTRWGAAQGTVYRTILLPLFRISSFLSNGVWYLHLIRVMVVVAVRIVDLYSSYYYCGGLQKSNDLVFLYCRSL